MQNKIIFIVGPTATGKTEVAFYLAKRIGAQIISCDSMQVYKGMKIISSQPPAAYQKAVPHHLVAVISAQTEYNVSRYALDAVKEAKEVLKNNNIPIFVGGTGLYMTVLLDGIFQFKSENQEIRTKLYQEASSSGEGYLHKKLAAVDPIAAAKIHPHDTKRIVRALEVFIVSGKPISVLWKERSGLWGKYDVSIYCLTMEREALYQRIEKRVENMFKDSLVDEVKKLLSMPLSKTAASAIGIKEIKGYLEKEYNLAQTKALIARNTCLYTKRQLTWFRKDKRIKWIVVTESDQPKEIAGGIWKELFS